MGVGGVVFRRTVVKDDELWLLGVPGVVAHEDVGRVRVAVDKLVYEDLCAEHLGDEGGHITRAQSHVLDHCAHGCPRETAASPRVSECRAGG